MIVVDRLYAYDFTGLGFDIVTLDAAAASVLNLELVELGSLSDSLLRNDQNRIALTRELHADDFIALLQTDTDNAHRRTAGISDLVFAETDRHALSRDNNDVVVFCGLFYLDQLVIVAKINGDDTRFADIGEVRVAGLLDDALSCNEKQILVLIILADRNQRGDLFFRVKLQKIDNCCSSRCSRRFGNPVGLHLVNPAFVREKQNCILHSGHQKVFDIVILDRHQPADSAAAAVLRLEFVCGHSLDVSEIGSCDNAVLVFYKIFNFELGKIRVVVNLCFTFVSVLLRDNLHFIADNAKQEITVCKNCLQPRDCLQKFLMLGLDLVSFQSCKSPQPHVDNRLRLHLVQTEPLHQFCLGFGDIRRRTDNVNDFVNIVNRDEQTLQDMVPLLRFL